jgi:glutaredoxin/glutathione-dependent peroxiredoxin
MIQVNDKLPDATLTETTEFGEACPVAPQKLSAAELARGKRVVIFGLPGAYTPTCSAQHVPGYLEHLERLKAKGVDEVWCVAVNDGFVMAAWGRELGAIGKLRLLGDGDAELTRKLGLDTVIPGMGVRSRRYSLLVEDGVVRQVNVEEPGKFVVSNAETLLEQLG